MIDRQELINKLTEEGVTAQLWGVGFNPKNNFDTRYPNLYGYVLADTKKRFADNERITTSIIEEIYTDENGRTFAKTYYSLYELMNFAPSEIPEDFRYAFDKKHQQFNIGDYVETVNETALLPKGLRTKIIGVEAGLYDPIEGDGFGYTIEYVGRDNQEHNLDYPNAYFKLIRKASL